MDNDKTITPTVAKDEFAGHTYEEFRLFYNLKHSVKDLGKIVRKEKKGINARSAMEELIKEMEIKDGGRE
jgi:hypothetical protein